MDRLGWARTLAFTGLALSLAALPIAYLWLGGPRTVAASGWLAIVQAVALFVPGGLVAVAGYNTYAALPVALRSRTRAPYLILIVVALLPAVLLTALLTFRLSPT